MEDRRVRMETRLRAAKETKATHKGGVVALAAILHLLCSLLDPRSCAAEAPWADGAVGRYRIEVATTIPTHDPAPVCAVRFFSGGLLQPNSENVRITDAKGTPLPVQIIYTHPLNASLVLFPLKANETEYHLFFGGTVASGVPPAKFDRGVFYETRARPEGDSSSWDAMRKLWASANQSHGVAIMDDMQSRCNPFDEQDDRFLSRTFGTWQFPRDDAYKFGLYAREQGFLAIDGQPAASTAPDAVAKTQPMADVFVARGSRPFEILQGRITGTGVTGISWFLPWPEYHGDNLIAKPVGAAWHPPVARAIVRDFVLRDQPTWACFHDFQADMLVCANQPIVRMRFHNRTGGKTDGVTYAWNFGDGTTSAEANPSHVYVKPGRYTVTLTAGGTRFEKLVLATSFAALPAAKIPMKESMNPFAAEEMMKLVTPRLGTFESGTLWTLIAMAEKIPDRKKRSEAVLALAPLYLQKAGTLATQAELSTREKMASARADLGQFDQAVAELRQMEPKLERQRTLRYKLQMQIGQLLQRAAKQAQAIEVFTRIANDKGGDDPKTERAAVIAIGDCHLQRGELASARKQYETAAQIEVGDGRTERERAIRRGSLYSTLRQAVNELAKLTLEGGGTDISRRETLLTLFERAQNSFDGLVFEFPDARLNPDVVYQTASLLLARGETAACRAELATLAKAEPSGRYALRSTLLEARASMADKDYDKATKLIDAVLKSTQEEPIVKEATTLQTLLAEATRSVAQFGDVARRYWPNNLYTNASFEVGAIEAGQPLPFSVEWSTPQDPPRAADVRVALDTGLAADGKRALMLEALKPITGHLYVTLRFPTAIGDRVFFRVRCLSQEADIRFLNLYRSPSQGEGIWSITGSTLQAVQQWGWLEQIANVEPWRQFSWLSGRTTAGAPQGYVNLFGIPKGDAKGLPAGTRIYIDAVECFLVP